MPLLEIQIRSRRNAVLFLAAIVIPAVALALFVARIALAETWANSGDIDKVKRAASLDPANPGIHYALGIIYLFEQRGTPEEPVQEFRKAVSLTPESAAYWLALAKGCYAAGDQACADQAFQRAIELAPSNPQYAWEASLNHAIAGRRAEAAATTTHLLRLDPGSADEVFRFLYRAFGDLEFIWRAAASTSSEISVKLAYLDFLGENREFGLASRCWQEVAMGKPVIPFPTAKPYLERLLAASRFAEALEVWSYLVQTGSIPRAPSPDRDNLVFNGGFEQKPLNGGFDWHVVRQEFLALDFAYASARSGRYALQIDFSVPNNAEYEPLYQIVPVVPGQSYLLSAFVRSEAITSDSGPRLRVVDPKCLACVAAESEGTSGTSPWHKVSLQFLASPETEVVRISIWRPRGRSFPMDISGRFWIDDVSLRSVQAAPLAADSTQPVL